MERSLRIFLLIIAMVIIPFNYYICEFFYPLNDEESIKMWWRLKEGVYGVIIAIILLSYSLTTRGVLRFILDICVGLTISNVIDRLCFNAIEFAEDDIIMIIATLLFAVIDYKKDGLTTNDKRATS